MSFRKTPLAVPVCALLLLGALPAHAQMFKWVDERGVVNYSNEPPKDVPAQRLAPVQDRVSTYSTPSRPQAPNASVGGSQPADSTRALRERVESLERDLDRERRRTDDDADRRRRAYDDCVQARGVDCERLVGAAAEPAVIVLPARRAKPPAFAARDTTPPPRPRVDERRDEKPAPGVARALAR